MSGPARLQALRVHGFKSFAERTVVEFVPGINAVIGPNGSGKSNLADALRWALGEQGRALRLRRAEDVVFAGSERRAALGMADVTLVLDNADGLVPVDYAVLEIGRRLFRSGENDYLVNRQRVRLRDLVELLDAAHLADNAFLFIGQGMVDQALALRPEERRPLFEEVAGVRRHERRRRRAEEQLGEASVNLARVEDILAELRPQVRRLAAQAEQQASRARAGDDLAEALVASFAARWHAAAAEAGRAGAALAVARGAAGAALEALQAVEGRAAGAAAEIAEHVALEAERRAVHEAARAALAGLDLERAAATAEAAAIARDHERLTAERHAAEAELAGHRRELALPGPGHDVAVDGELAETEHALAEARAEAGALRAATARRSEAGAALLRAAAAKRAELETLRRRVAAAERARGDATEAATGGEARAAEARRALEAAGEATVVARSAEEAARARLEAARLAAAATDAARVDAADAAAAARSAAAALRGRVDAVRSWLKADEGRGIAPPARRAGGRALAGDLEIDPALRPLVAAALGELGRSFVIERAALERLAGERGIVVLGDAEGAGAEPPASAEAGTVRREAARRGGGLLGEAVRADPTGAARRLLARWAWTPSLSEAVELAAALPPGWRVAVRGGGTVGSDGVVALGAVESALERRAELDGLERGLAEAEAAATSIGERLAAAEVAAAAARQDVEAARRGEAEAAGRRRGAEETERQAARAVEQGVREAAWSTTRATALAAELAPLAERLAALEEEASPAGEPETADEPGAVGKPGAADEPAVDIAAALGAWDARVGELAGRRETLAAARAVAEADRRSAENRLARAEAAAQIAEERIRRADREADELARRQAALDAARAVRETAHAEAVAREAAARTALEAVRAADVAGRDRLRLAEAAVATARDGLRRADEQHRTAEVHDLEARLALEAVREQALVELAGLGALGLLALDPAAGEGAEDDEGAVAAAFTAAAAAWAARPAPPEVPPPGRLASLRRRFHELGATNPYAAEEHAELRARVDGLEAQRADLVGAIEKTRGLLAELDGLIARQFRATFAALETAFDRQFQQLFGGGFARLSLTDPADLAQTGVEIVARPPGKKAQALATLSGGERALTAVALLFAMLEVRPVPFCVLDEVDAALDEANVGRFVDALRALAQTTQFVVITHNRGTIEAADALYGVTVGEDAVSRVVSLRIEEAHSRIEEAHSTAERFGDARGGPAPAGAIPAG
jgi:chromosome segregation protein